MSDLADMMLDGTLCQDCGVYVHGQACGVPRRCSYCKRATPGVRLALLPDAVVIAALRTACTTCGRRVKLVGLADHMRDVHGQA